MTSRARVTDSREGARKGDADMSIAGTSVSLLAAVASVAVILAVAIIWLVLTNPVGIADALQQGEVTPLVKQLAGAILSALQGLLKYL